MLRSGSGPAVFRLRCSLGNDDTLVFRSWLELYSKMNNRQPRLDIPAALLFSDIGFSERIRRFSKRQIHTKSFLSGSTMGSASRETKVSVWPGCVFRFDLSMNSVLQ